jgi:hypothetical protein
MVGGIGWQALVGSLVEFMAESATTHAELICTFDFSREIEMFTISSANKSPI